MPHCTCPNTTRRIRRGLFDVDLVPRNCVPQDRERTSEFVTCYRPSRSATVPCGLPSATLRERPRTSGTFGPRATTYTSRADDTRETKANLHASGSWRFGFTEQAALARPDLVANDADRDWVSMDRPPEQVPGITCAIHLVFMNSELALTPGNRGHKLWRTSIFLQPAPDGYAGVTTVFFTEGPCPRPATGPDIWIADLTLPRGEHVHHVYHIEPDTGAATKLIRREVTRVVAEADPERVALPESGYIYVLGNRPDRSRFIVGSGHSESMHLCLRRDCDQRRQAQTTQPGVAATYHADTAATLRATMLVDAPVRFGESSPLGRLRLLGIDRSTPTAAPRNTWGRRRLPWRRPCTWHVGIRPSPTRLSSATAEMRMVPRAPVEGLEHMLCSNSPKRPRVRSGQLRRRRP